jgi:hypothetical protein
MQTVRNKLTRRHCRRCARLGHRARLFGFAMLAVCWPLCEASADSLRCGHKVVSTGDSAEELRRHCGEPLQRESGREQFWLRGTLQQVRVERWHYRHSSRSLPRVVLVYQGKIVAITSGSR